jgi:hypothetical protein
MDEEFTMAEEGSDDAAGRTGATAVDQPYSIIRRRLASRRAGFGAVYVASVCARVSAVHGGKAEP